MSASQRKAGRDMHRLIARLYPICRSITGDGVRRTLKILGEHIPLKAREVPSGRRVFDWTVPKEWNIHDACVKDPRGRKIIDFRKSNLHVVSYSVPLRRKMPLAELKKHLFSRPDRPDWIPYRTSYWAENWGFCLSHKQLKALKPGTYEVVIDSSLKRGRLTYGECFIKGKTSEEVLISTHICHPSLANDNLSGIVVATFLAKAIAREKPRYSYRFLFIPGTIGSITWLALNEKRLKQIKHGLVLAGVGDAGKPTYKRTRRGDAEIDRAVIRVLRASGKDHAVQDFSPYGYDERQYCSPGFNLPVGCFSRTPFGKYPEYHTSADNLGFVKPRSLAESLALVRAIFQTLEKGPRYLNTNPKCEPQLGRRGLFKAIGGAQDREKMQMLLLWILNLSDGGHSLPEIAERARVTVEEAEAAARILKRKGLLTELR